MSGERPRFALDTNILIYAVDAKAGAKSDRAELIVRRAVESRRCVLAFQSIGEFYSAVVRKRLVAPEAAARRASRYLQLFPVVDARAGDAPLALAEAAAGRHSYWDALLLVTLGRAGCSLLLSEDMADGGRLGPVTILNPLRGDALPANVTALLA